jgi:hypothetical protein
MCGEPLHGRAPSDDSCTISHFSGPANRVEGKLDLQLTVTPPGKVTLFYCLYGVRGKPKQACLTKESVSP